MSNPNHDKRLKDAHLPEAIEGWPAGHFYSPIPSLSDVRRREDKLFGVLPLTIPGIDLRETGQIKLFEALCAYYPEQPFSDTKTAQRRFFFDNPNFSYGEAVILYCMMRHLKPKKIIEVGCGYSSCAILDANELFFNSSIACTFIEPYPNLLQSLIRPADLKRIQVLRTPLQEAPLDLFSTLSSGDILVIDSTHVSKIGSDVNQLLFEVLPALAEGVYIHIHDICYPFEYPKAWIYQGRSWNEAYLLRAFLQYNTAFEIVFFNSYFGLLHGDKLAAGMPLCAKNPGSSLWLRKRGKAAFSTQLKPLMPHR